MAGSFDSIPEDLRLCVEMLMHCASKHKFVFQGMLERLPQDKPVNDGQPDIMMIRNTNNTADQVAECFRMYADMIDKTPKSDITQHKVGRPV